jgi:C1A family cysteine protease
MQRQIQRYGWKPDLPDFRDFYYRDYHSNDALKAVVAPLNPIAPAPIHQVVQNTAILGPDGLPLTVSLRSKMPPVFNQGQLGSCTANAAAAMWAFVHGGGPYSRLQLYYYERLIDGTVDHDSGAYLRDAIQVLAQTGVGLEQDWPYDVSQFAVQPPAIEMNEAAKDKASVYSRLATRQDFRECLSQGFPFIIGISVYSSFETDAVAQTGIVPMPLPTDSMIGGHAVCVIGYGQINGEDHYEVRNSWGDWGDRGYCWIPAAYLENSNLATDSWTIRR